MPVTVSGDKRNAVRHPDQRAGTCQVEICGCEP